MKEFFFFQGYFCHENDEMTIPSSLGLVVFSEFLEAWKLVEMRCENGDPRAEEVQCGTEVKSCVCGIMGMERESRGKGALSGPCSQN